jgi:hypothetical protein
LRGIDPAARAEPRLRLADGLGGRGASRGKAGAVAVLGRIDRADDGSGEREQDRNHRQRLSSLGCMAGERMRWGDVSLAT